MRSYSLPFYEVWEKDFKYYPSTREKKVALPYESPLIWRWSCLPVFPGTLFRCRSTCAAATLLRPLGKKVRTTTCQPRPVFIILKWQIFNLWTYLAALPREAVRTKAYHFWSIWEHVTFFSNCKRLGVGKPSVQSSSPFSPLLLISS